MNVYTIYWKSGSVRSELVDFDIIDANNTCEAMDKFFKKYPYGTRVIIGIKLHER